jgi:hypothetical protein
MRRESISQPEIGNDKERVSDANLALFGEFSGADAATSNDAQELIGRLPESPSDPFEAAKSVRRFLVSEGFVYSNHAFRLQDMMEKRQGNCLGLTLLIGAALESRGFKPDYEILLNPHDAVYERERRFFEELREGTHPYDEDFSFANPLLPSGQGDLFRFAPLEHPVIVVGDRRFEATSLDPEPQDEDWSPKAELVRRVGFREVASNVLVDRAKTMSTERGVDYASVKKTLERGLAEWPENREGWAFAHALAEGHFDDALAEQARRRYEEIGGDDARFHFTRYEMTGDESDLDAALAREPSYVAAFMAKRLKRVWDEREARFDFAVAANCLANSSETPLLSIFPAYAKTCADLFGEDALVELLEDLGAKERDPVYELSLWNATGDEEALKAIRREDWPKMPRNRLEFCLGAMGILPGIEDEIVKLEAEYGKSESFRAMVGRVDEPKAAE